MKVFFFHVGTPTPIIETELELIRTHERQGDTVRVLQCSGSLSNCHWNQTHDLFQCAACRSRFSKGWKVLNPGGNVELKQFAVDDIDVSGLPRDFESVEQLKLFRHDDAALGYGVASGLISIFRDHRFDTKTHRRAVTRELRTAVQVHEALKREFIEFKPDRVYIFNGRIATHLPAYLLCRKMGIEFFSYEVAGKPDSYRLLRNKTVHAPVSFEEIEALRSEWTAEHQEIAETVIRRRRLGKHLSKIPVFTADQVRGFLPKGFDPSRKNIVIFNSTLDEYAGVEGWTSPIYGGDETAAVARILESLEDDDRFMFYLRVHPHMKEVPPTTSQLVDIRHLSERFRNLRVIWPQEEIDSYALLDACEKTLTFGSTIGIEATYWGKPSILAGRAFYENMDCVYLPGSHEDLLALIRSDLQPRPAESALMYFYWEVSDGTPYAWFKETGLRNGLATGVFDGVEIRPAPGPKLAFEIGRFIKGAVSALKRPSTAFARLKQYAKTIH